MRPTAFASFIQFAADDGRGSIREGRLPAARSCGRQMIDPETLDEVRDEMYPMLPLPPEWQKMEDGSPAPNWVAAIALSRQGR